MWIEGIGREEGKGSAPWISFDFIKTVNFSLDLFSTFIIIIRSLETAG